MDLKTFPLRHFLWIAPLSLALGAGMASLQAGDWFIGWAAFSFLFLLSCFLLMLSARWAASTAGLDTADNRRLLDPPLSAKNALAWMVALAFILRLAVGVTLYLALPVNGHDTADDRAGFVFTDAHRRDNQAWELASSTHPIIDAFREKYAYDQYGGLLAFSALVYRYLSPDAHRPLMLALLSALIAALGIPFLWKAVSLQWGAKLALAAGWIFALYPESVLLGSEAMREPYLMTFSALALWGFVEWRALASPSASLRPPLNATIWIGLGILGMLLVSPAIALVTLVIFAGWLYFTSERGRIPWSAVAVGVAVFVVGLLVLSFALNRRGGLDAVTPFGVLNNFMRLAVKWDVHQLERGSGWIQKLFAEMPTWLWLPFVVVYGVFQPVLPAALVEPTTLTWGVIAILRAVGWYALLPALILSFAAGFSSGSTRDRKVWLWLAAIAWGWILLAALRGGGDQWDNPRYRAILFLWQAILAGQAFVWWRASRNVWATRVLLAEIAFLAVFSQWYASRYFKWGAQLPFGGMIALIVGLWALIAVGGWLWDRRTRHA